MKTTDDKGVEATPKTNRRYEMATMHLFDTEAREEKPLCGAGVPVIDLIGVDYYLERREEGLPVGTVCEDCKAEIVRLVEKRCRESKADAGVYWPRPRAYGSAMPCAIGTAWRRRRWRPTACCTGRRSIAGLPTDWRGRPAQIVTAARRQARSSMYERFLRCNPCGRQER